MTTSPLLSPDADAVRGLRTPVVGRTRQVLQTATAELHALLEGQVMPLLLSCPPTPVIACMCSPQLPRLLTTALSLQRMLTTALRSPTGGASASLLVRSPALTTTLAPVAEAAPQHASAHHGAYTLLPHRYARTRREAAMADACSLACHIAFAYSSIAASQADDARTAAMLAGASKSAAAAAVYDARDELPLFALLSSR